MRLIFPLAVAAGFCLVTALLAALHWRDTTTALVLLLVGLLAEIAAVAVLLRRPFRLIHTPRRPLVAVDAPARHKAGVEDEQEV